MNIYSFPFTSSSRLFRVVSTVLALMASFHVEVHADSPNIIFIMADDLGYGDLGCYGGEHIATPHIDRLAAEGIRFTQAYAGSPVCAPSRCVLMTGMHAGHAYIRGNGPKVGGILESFGEGSYRLSMTGNEVTVADRLRGKGYATGAAGKWGIGEPESEGTPLNMGFDEWLGYLNQNHAAYYYTDFLWKNDRKMLIPGNAKGTRSVYSNDLFCDFALTFIRENRSRPFFLYLPITIPHDLMEVPDLGAYAEKAWPEKARVYAAMVSRMDGYVGKIMSELKELGIDDNTIVFFTSDNGPAAKPRSETLDSAARLRGRKGDVYEGGLRVPMIARWPGKIDTGVSSEQPWMFVDVFPTLVDLAGAAVGNDLDGVSIVPTLLGGKQDLSDRALYWEFPRDSGLWQAARRGKWKVVRAGMDEAIELYDLSRDPYEERDVAEFHADIVDRFRLFFSSQHVPSLHWPDESL